MQYSWQLQYSSTLINLGRDNMFSLVSPIAALFFFFFYMLYFVFAAFFFFFFLVSASQRLGSSCYE